ncbi:MAG: RagB/SusD family nutrient uptake outer membrane protein [Rikenellaceae bacterium]
MLLTNVGCSDFLDVTQDSVQDADDYWKTKEEVKAVVMSCYVSMRTNLAKFVQWGDLRADIMAIGPAATSNEDMNELKDLQITSENSICNWVYSYEAIARCNSVLENAESALLVDDTFDESLCKAYMAEAMWVRSLNYFTLVRTFRDVPYITWAYISDDQDFCVAKSDGELILDDVLLDLESYYTYAPNDYTETWENKGRATKGAYFALMADICLWRERYDEVIVWCDSLDNLKLYSLLPEDNWFELYYPGNSDESIFELQWSSTYSQTNSLRAWFYNGTSNQTYAISSSGTLMFESGDIRGLNGTYLSSNKVWKYGGAAANGSTTRSNYDQNWIFYRYADMLLIRSEALAMQGDYATSHDLILEVRERAGCSSSTNPSQASNESNALANVMAERAREFAFEGKRWFDLVRWATIKENIYQDNLIQVMLANISASLRPLFEVKLLQEDSYYMPIYQTDIESSDGVLIQNPYYN